LRRVAQLFAGTRDLLREDPQMIPKAEHVFEYADRLPEVLFFVRASLQDVSETLETTITWKDVLW
jgi:hypothetical protein